MIGDLLNLFGIAVLAWLLLDFWRLIRKAHAALDRDQDILDRITNDDDYVTLDELNIICVDTTDMAKQDAVLAFIDAWEKHYEQSHD